MSQNLHKIFKEIFELSNEDAYILQELSEAVRDARSTFANVGTEFTYERFKEYFKRVHSYNLQKNPGYVNPMIKVIEGDNLDIIEEEAKKKGLI
jgi:hypothetical protein